MAELIGKESVKAFIERSKKKRFKIFGSGDDLKKSAPKWVAEDGSPVEEFEAWADMVDGDGTNTTGYKIKCYDTDEDGIGKPSIIVTFQLNRPTPRTLGAPGTQPGVLTEARLLEILNGQKPAVDVNAAIASAIQKTAHHYQMEILTKQIQHLQQESAANLADMREEMLSAMEDEEDEEAKQKKDADLQLKLAQMENDKMKMIMSGAQYIVEQGKGIAYEFLGRGGAANTAKSLKVSGPTLAPPSTTSGFQIPVSDQPGELAIDYKAPAVSEDQTKKINTYVGKLFVETNDHMGNDMALLYKMYKDMPEKYSEMIWKLRELMGYGA